MVLEGEVLLNSKLNSGMKLSSTFQFDTLIAKPIKRTLRRISSMSRTRACYFGQALGTLVLFYLIFVDYGTGDGFISLQSEDEWFVILKLTEIYRCGSALFLSPSQHQFWV